MKSLVVAAAFAAVTLFSFGGMAQAPSTAHIAARVELHPLSSLTLSDQQVLTGDRNGPAVTVAGEFRVAQGSGRLPVVVLMHGSSGIGANMEVWTAHLNAMGISTFAIDGFTGRGLVSVSADQAKLGRLSLIIDIYQALGVLAKHPRVDPERIALMGFSRGGQAALYASMARLHKLWNTSGIGFSAYIPFYPDCATTYLNDAETVEKPIRIFHGTPDDYNPVRTCKAYVERLKAAGRDATVTEYADAPHGFDSPTPMLATIHAKNSQTVRNCTIRESEGGVLINTATNAPFTYKDACVELGPHVGSNLAAGFAVRKAVGDYLQTLFRPK